MSRFKHDCTSCVYLGEVGEYDTYYCSQGGARIPTVVKRFGDEPEAYLSGWHYIGDLPFPMRRRAASLAERNGHRMTTPEVTGGEWPVDESLHEGGER